MGRGTRAAMLTLGLAGAGVFTGTTIGAAQDPVTEPSWNCRASLIRVEEGLNLLGSPIEPLIANGQNSKTAPDNAACAPDGQSAQNELNLAPLAVLGDVLEAQTTIAPDTTSPRKTRVNTATASAEKLSVLLADPIPGGNLVTADAVQSTAVAKCVPDANGVLQPELSGSSQIVNLKVAGQAIPVDDIVDAIAVPITNSPLSALAKIYVNRQQVATTSRGTTLTQTALRVELLSILGELVPPVATVVLGETKVSTQDGNVCADETPPPTVTTTTTVPGPTQTVPGPTQTVPGPTQTVPGPTTTQTVPVPVPVPGPTTVGGQGTPVQINGTNGSRSCARLTMFFAKNRKSALGVRFGKERVVTRGRITDCRGRSIVRARIDVVHVLPGGKELVKTGLRSRAQGRLTLILPRNLFTRKLRFAYRGDLNSTRITTRRTLQINVRDARNKLITKAPKGQGKPRF